MHFANTKTNPYEKADQRVKKMSDLDLETTWNAIKNGGLRNCENNYINGITCDEWMELVYSEISIRNL